MSGRTRVPLGKQRVRVDTGIYLKATGKYLAVSRVPAVDRFGRSFQRGRALRNGASERGSIPVDPLG
jgi:hypothetical protein